MAIIFSILGIVALAAAFVLIRAAMLPNDFRVSRSATIKAPREKIFPLIDDMKAFNLWNPFAKMDPSIQTTYRGPASGPGAAYDWTGTGKAGQGCLAIVESSAPTSIRMKLDILKPMEGHNVVVFGLLPAADATEVSWTMTGPYPYRNRIFGTIFNMDKIIGGTFENGLADLKKLAEQ